jgi:zinc-ribbon domain
MLDLFWLLVAVLNLVAIHRIITKAGYSGWWILLPIAPLASMLIGLAATAHAVRTGSVSHLLHTLAGWYVTTGLIFLVDWIFFLVFAFSEWPVLGELRDLSRRPPGGSLYPYGVGFPAPTGPPPFTAPWASSPPGQPGGGPMTSDPRRVLGPVPPVPAYQSSASPASACPNCGRANEEASRFCGQCGTSLP